MSKIQCTDLMNLFIPAGFSILDNLDLELELDDDAGISAVPQIIPAPSFGEHIPSTIFEQTASTASRATFTLDASKPLFFPLDSSFTSAPSAQLYRGGKGPKDIVSIFHERGWTRDVFCRTDSAENIRKRWEDSKVELTREWKRRHREAVKAARRRGGAHD